MKKKGFILELGQALIPLWNWLLSFWQHIALLSWKIIGKIYTAR